MLINEIRLYNFRQFSGKHSITFSTDESKNITIIMGDNGSGKTTLAQAFQWALYGKTEFKIKELINRDVRDALEPNEPADVKVELYIRQEGKEYQIRRRQKILRERTSFKVIDNSFSIASKNMQTGEWDYLNEGEEAGFIKRMLPVELSRFFFFDGERIRNLSEEIEKGKSKEFADAVKNLVGLTAMMSAINHLKPSQGSNTVIGKINKEIDAHGEQELAKYTTKIQKIETDLEPTKKRLDEIENLPNHYVDKIAETKQEILAMAPLVEQREKYNEMQKKLENLKSAKLDATNKLFSIFSKKIADFYTQPLVKASLLILKDAGDLDAGIPALHVDTIQYLLDRKYCICGTPLDKYHIDELKKVTALLDKALPKTVGQMVGAYSDNCRNRTKLGEDFYDTIETHYRLVRENINDTEKISKAADALFESLSDTSRSDKLKKDLQRYENENKRINDEVINLKVKIERADHDIAQLENKREKLILIDKKNKDNIILREYAKYVYELINDDFVKREKQTRQKLEDTINQIFIDIYDGGIKLSVDEKYNLKVIVTDTSAASGDELERNTAQNYAIIFAFISGIIKLAKEKSKGYEEFMDEDMSNVANHYPLVMDAPLSAFDTKRIKNICDTLPQIADQIIIFIKDTDGNIAEEHMGDKIGARWLLKAKTKTESIIEKR